MSGTATAPSTTSHHPELPGHCAACAAKLEEFSARVQRLEDLLEDLDGTLAKFIRGTRPETVTNAEIDALREEHKP
jgi:hypothetical protein